MKKSVAAGAGKKTIVLPETLFPQEGYSGERDPIHVRTLILEQEERTVIISIEIPSIRNAVVMNKLRRLAVEVTGVKDEYLWVCTTHNMGTLHIPRETEKEKHETFVSSLLEAVESSLKEAVSNMTDAKIGIAFDKCDINTSRDIRTNQGWWNGLDGESVTDKQLTVFKFEKMNGELIAILYHYPVKCCTLQDSWYEDGTRISSSELSGEASNIIEACLQAPALFFMGAAADMVPKKCAAYSIADENGDLRHMDLGIKKGFEFRKELGDILGRAVIDLADHIQTKAETVIRQNQKTFWYKGQEFYNLGWPYRPTPDYQYHSADDEKLDICLLAIDDTVLIGMSPETTAVIGIKMRERTEPITTLLVSLVNGGKDYLADELSYERCTFSGTHSVFARGSAEQFLEDAAEEIRRLYQEQ